MKRRPFALFALLMALLLALSACGGVSLAGSRLERIADPQVSSADLDQLVADNAAFAFDFLRLGADPSQNAVFSPYSLSLAFAMAYAGARGETASQMAQVMHYALPAERLHAAFNALDLDLARRPDQALAVDEDDRFDLSIANAIWGQEGWNFLPEYLDLLAQNYGAGLRLVDFQEHSEQARRLINDWVSDQTHKRIRDIIPAGQPDPATRLALVNAIYFKAVWEHEFDPNETEDAPFTLLDGSQAMVEMMSLEQGEDFAYAAGEGWQAIALPYKGGLTDMVVIMPDEGNFEAFMSALDQEAYAAILGALEPLRVLLSMPKFTFETRYDLGGTLVGLGMTDAFDPGSADFSGIDGLPDLYISQALHQAFIAVDEKGTEAAAATVVLMALSAMPMEGFILTIDQPFFFVIRDVPTGSILFMGQVIDPR
jgi:serpin B